MQGKILPRLWGESLRERYDQLSKIEKWLTEFSSELALYYFSKTIIYEVETENLTFQPIIN